MASTYPGSLDSFDTIASDKKTSDAVGGRTHRQMHNDLGDAIEAVQTELGTDPAGTFATVKARLAAYDAYAAKTGAYTATVDDGTLNVTSGTFTLDLPAANTFTGRTLKVKNSGTGVVTLDGNSSETVEGVATFPLGPGSYVEITSTGAAWILTAGVPDTGWREVTASLDSGFTTANPDAKVYVRRSGATVQWGFAEATAGTGGGTATIWNAVPTGFRASTTPGIECVACIDAATALPVSESVYLSGASLLVVGWTARRHSASLVFLTTAAWPTSLPGTAV